MESNRQASKIEAALLDFHRHPGRYPAGQKSPAVLYASIKEVLQIAASRAGDDERGAPSDALKNAACFFVRTALLYRDADHYSLLGLDRSADTTTVKEQYRWMMRLIHPDFAGGSTQVWPADAAVRVNLAYEVLSSSDKRGAYDKQLDEPITPQATKIDSRPMGLHRSPRPTPEMHAPRHWLARMAMVFGGVGVVAILLLMVGQQEKDNLVQRASDPSDAAPAQTSAGRKPTAVATADARRASPGSSQEPRAQGRSSFSDSISNLFGMGSRPSPSAGVPPPLHAKPLAPALPDVPAPVAAPAAPAEPVQAAAPAPAPVLAPAPVPVPPARVAVAAPAPAPAVAPAPTPAAAPMAMAPLNAPPAPAPSRRPIAGLTLAEAQPLLSNLLQQIESGSGDRMLNLLERDARNDQSAQALLRHYNSLVLGARPVKLSHVQFKAEPRDGRLLVTGMVRLQVGEQGSAGKELAMQAEFASRDGTVVMTRLARAGAN